ncbi:TIGR01906 family membrane protein [Lutispora sp.]|uniref:TIGR01906 family membrane protein n=1 Tax=Lutispora sp. TaxID=2828727 RepID=UPI00356B17ED
MLQKILKNSFYVLLALFLSLFILLTATELIAFNMSYYDSQYEKNNIYGKLGIKQEDLMESTEKLLNYLKDKRKDLDFKVAIRGEEQEFLSPRDKLHMVDVKNLFVIGRNIRNGIFIFFLCLIGILIFKKSESNLSKLFLLSSILGTLPIIVLIMLINIDFYKYFTIFHEIFFNNDLWLLDPKVDRLVNIFPETFFYDVALRIIIYYLTVQAVLFILGLTINIRRKLNRQ